MDFVSYNFTELISPNISLSPFALASVFSTESNKSNECMRLCLFLILEERLSAFRWKYNVDFIVCNYLEVHSHYTHFTHFINPLAACRFFLFVVGFEKCDFNVPWYCFLHIICTWDLWTCVCWYTVLSNLEKISHYFFKYFLSILPLIPKNPITCIFCHLKLSHSSLMLFFLFALKCISVFYFGYSLYLPVYKSLFLRYTIHCLTCPMYFSSQIL